jgi:hypothetical protein
MCKLLIRETIFFVFRQFIRPITKITCAYMGFFIFAVISYVASSLLFPTIINGTIHKNLMFGHSLNIQTTPWFEILYSIQILASILVSISTGYEMAAPFIIMMAAAHFRILKNRLDFIQKKELLQKNQEGFKQIIACILYHQKINRYVDYYI